MAKRATALIAHKKSKHSKKTTKRLLAKNEMLQVKRKGGKKRK